MANKLFWRLCNCLLALIFLCKCKQVVIPLTYATDPRSSRKYPIKLVFNSSQTTTPYQSSYLALYNQNITIETTQSNKQYVEIGLQHPSAFLSAVQQTFKIQSKLIELGKDEYTQLIINGNNFVQSTDDFINGQMYTVRAKQNFGDDLKINNQRCFLIDDQFAYFDEFLILQILNIMDKRNGIHFTQDPAKNTIDLQGNIQNFPKISFLNGKSIFQIELKTPVLHYIARTNNSQALNYIGYKSLTKFSKFQIASELSNGQNGKIIFKRTSQLYQLYLFLGYFFIFTMLFLIFSRDKLQASMVFVKSVVDWVLFQNRQARIRVLRTQLQ